MMRPAPRAGATERLDERGHSLAELAASLDHIGAYNRWLGARRALLLHARPLLPAGRPARILDVGTGAADLPLALVRAARRRGYRPFTVVLDAHPQIIRIARERIGGTAGVHAVQGDAFQLPHPDNAFDLVLLSMTLHHLEAERRVDALRELARVAAGGLIVGELERCWPNYLGARLLAATLWRRNPLTRHDGPVSVLRAFTAQELLELAAAAGLGHATVHRHFFHRLVLLARPRRRPWT